MADPTDKVSVGQRLRIPAGVWNDLIDAARQERAGRAARTSGGEAGGTAAPHLTVLVRNGTGSALPAGRCVRATGLEWDHADAPREFARRPMLTAALPAAETDAPLVSLEAIPDGQVGRAVCLGVTVADVNVLNTAHLFASPDASSPGLKTSSLGGSVRILATPGGTGTRSCVVLVGYVACA